MKSWRLVRATQSAAMASVILVEKPGSSMS